MYIAGPTLFECVRDGEVSSYYQDIIVMVKKNGHAISLYTRI